MPFKLRKAPGKELYWVVDDKGRHYSDKPMTRSHATKQLVALRINYSR